MEAPISKFIHVQQPETYWHQELSTAAFKSPDLIELNSDTEKNAKPVVEPLNYSSSQEEGETEDDTPDAPETHLKEPLATVYDVTSNDEESCHLLQTEDDSESSHSEHGWRSSESGGGSPRSSSGGTISDGEGKEERRSRMKQLENYWDMSAEQEKYYTEQFLTLQSDLGGMVTGSLAKGFFEKSKLPHMELREIWQLADITRDGCLDLNEFKMAMHLVVLRRHGLPIPSHFYLRQPEFAKASSAAAASKTTSSKSKQPRGTDTTPSTHTHHNHSSQASNDSTQHHGSQTKRPSKEWTTFENEPVNFSSTCDTSGLVAPVPVRLKTPEDKLIISSGGMTPNTKTQQLQLRAIQRPKLSGHHPKGTIAPPPPPRRKTHVRSSSLDLNRLTISNESAHPPVLNGTRGPDSSSRSFLSPSHQGGAFSVYCKPQHPRTATLNEPSIIPTGILSNQPQLEQEVGELTSENDHLSRISTQLLDQLSLLQSRRQSVAYKIQHLHHNFS